MRCWIVIGIIAILSTQIVFSDHINCILRDITNNEVISNVAVYMTVENETENYFLQEDGILTIDTRYTDVLVTIKADDFSTLGNDYYQRVSRLHDDTDTLYLVPVGSVRGIVKDKLDNVVPYARLQFACGKEENFPFPAHTDEFGSFFLDFMPVGQCRILTSHEDATGTTDVELRKGEMADVEILLDKSIVGKPKMSALPFLILLVPIIILLILIYWALRRRNKTKKSPQTQHKILQTLNEKERVVIEYIMEHRNKANQAAVRHATSLPRTTLSRILEALRKKKIIHIEKHGKCVTITLTDFFLGKD